MRNLKRTLTLVLAVIMVIGVMAIGAGAAFKDDASITYKDAVNTLSSLNVLKGDENGFRPGDKITRAEMAAVIYRFMNGGDSLSGYPASSRFTDVPASEWYAIYVEYCATAGVIAGNGDGTFTPNDNVTGYAAMKMVETALGYNAEKEGLVGATWDSASLILANNLKLNKGMKSGFDASKEITREQVALIVNNALKQNVKQWLNTLEVYATDLNGNPEATALEKYFGAEKKIAVVLANDEGILDETGSQTAANKKFAGTTLVTDIDDTAGDDRINVATTADLLGQQVEVYVIGENEENGFIDVVGEPAPTAKNTVVENNYKALSNKDADTNGSLLKLLKDNGLKIGTPDYITFANGTVDYTAFDSVGAGEFARFIDNDGDQQVDLAIRIVKNVKTVTSVGKADKDGVSEYAGVVLGTVKATTKNTTIALKKNDVVLAYYYNGKVNAEVLTPITGKMTGATGTTKIAIAGVSYGKSAINQDSGYFYNSDYKTLADWITNLGTNAEENTDGAYAYYLDNGNNIIFVDKVKESTSKTYAVVTKLAWTAASGLSGSSKAEARLVFTDGKTEDVVLKVASSVNTEDKLKAAYPVDKIYSYTVDESTGKYELTAATASAATTVNFTKGSNKSSDGLVSSTATKFVVKGGTASKPTYTSYTGYAQLPSLTKVDYVAVKNSNGYATFVYIVGETTKETITFVSTGENATLVPASGSAKAYWEMPIIKDGAKTTVKVPYVDGKKPTDYFAAGKLYKSVPLVDGKVDVAAIPAPVATATLEAKSIADGNMKIDGTVYTYTSSTVVYTIEKSGSSYTVSKGTVAEIDTKGDNFTVSFEVAGTGSTTKYQIKTLYIIVE